MFINFSTTLINVVCICSSTEGSGAAIISLIFDGGGNIDEVDGVVDKTSLCQLLLKFRISDVDLDLGGDFTTPLSS